jgi:hypothetical protein
MRRSRPVRGVVLATAASVSGTVLLPVEDAEAEGL